MYYSMSLLLPYLNLLYVLMYVTIHWILSLDHSDRWVSRALQTLLIRKYKSNYKIYYIFYIKHCKNNHNNIFRDWIILYKNLLLVKLLTFKVHK